MVFWDTAFRMIAGRGLAEKSERRQLEKRYQHVEEVVRNIKEVANEPRPETPNLPESVYTRHTAPTPIRNEGSVRSVQLSSYERCASSPSLPNLPTFKSPCGPPDITARELTKDELKRNYSNNNIWNVQEQPLPPMPLMRGFGKYRSAVNASPEWQMAHLDRHLHDVRGLLVDHFGDSPPVGLDSQTWKMYRSHHSRAGSTASSKSSDSGTGPNVAEEYLDSNTGTRISRGFCPSVTSSANSSFKEGATHYRRDSNFSSMSMTGSGTDGGPRHPRRTSRPSPFRASRHASTTSMIGLAAITKIQENAVQPARKVEKPCRFDDDGDPESALASDEEDEFDWTDMLEVNGAAQRGNLAKQLERKAKSQAGAAVRPALTRQRTTSDERKGARGLKRTVFERSRQRRTSSRAPFHPLPLTRAQTEPATKAPREQPVSIESKKHNLKQRDHPAFKTTKSQTIVDATDDEPLAKAAAPACKENFQALTKLANVSENAQGDSQSISATPSPDHILGQCLDSIQSDTSNETLFMPLRIKKDLVSPCRQRQRSCTVSTIRPQ